MGAFTSQYKPGNQRHVQIPWNTVFAFWTMRGWMHNAEVARHSVNADIEKTPNHAAEYEPADSPKMERHALPMVWIEKRCHVAMVGNMSMLRKFSVNMFMKGGLHR